VVVIANDGKRAAEFSATLTLYSEHGMVHVVRVFTETLSAYVYADKPALVRGRGRVRVVNPRIVEAYEYLDDGEMTHWATS